MGRRGKMERFHNISRRVAEGLNHSIQDRKFKKGGQDSTNQEKEERLRDRLEQVQ